MKRGRYLVIFGTVLVLSLTGCGNKDAKKPEKEPLETVQITKATEETMNDPIHGTEETQEKLVVDELEPETSPQTQIVLSPDGTVTEIDSNTMTEYGADNETTAADSEESTEDLEKNTEDSGSLSETEEQVVIDFSSVEPTADSTEADLNTEEAGEINSDVNSQIDADIKNYTDRQAEEILKSFGVDVSLE
jgi:hypothetical protein